MSQTKHGGPLHDLTGFQRDLLVAIATEGPTHGLGLKSHLEDAFGVQEIHHGRLYPNLDTLVEKGLVEKTAADRRTNEYALTARGRRELAAHREWVAGDGGEAEA
ncbi:PadR family transcriptional regulator [Haloarcula sp. JP-L23]|uniref:PadR family transcriptional regulator n=1 Tax=Haloarcula sp. JP-L23 TaxID=2716717 RepID=UPI00140F47A7|nr:helix-turn-helix transcriptional regulator [Haloarcula sp. JP-L23]